MKKILMSIALVGTMCSTLSAQGTLKNKDKQLNIGLGMSNYGLPVYAGLDFGVGNDITFGLEGSINFWNNYKHSHSDLGLGINGNYHFNRILELPQKMDLYAGLNLGFRFHLGNYESHDYSGLGFGGQLGFRYFFTNTVAFQIEANGGNAVSGGKLGFTFKL
ncbi:MAG TPA: hypothetical protein PKX92_05520 [Edaphocola sp.]|nr:hypothetical protein [Edaphocola sp.]